eukprot:658046-Prorocentrum_minimum.AAC.2
MNNFRRSRPLLARMKHLLKSNAVKEPLWYQAVTRTPPAEMPLKASRPPKLVYEEVFLTKLASEMKGLYRY